MGTMSAILNAIIGELTDVGRLILKLGSEGVPFDIQFEQDGKKYVMVVRELQVVETSDKTTEEDIQDES